MNIKTRHFGNMIKKSTPFLEIISPLFIQHISEDQQVSQL